MYHVGIFANISELTTFPFANIKTYAEEKFSQKENYQFTLYTKEQKELFIANVQTGKFNGIVFATNTANDPALKIYFENNKEVFSRFLSLGGGILVLLQYHLAIANSFFDIFSESDFPGLANTKIITRQNNNNNSPVAYDKSKLKCHDSNLIFSYPIEVLKDTGGSFFSAMENNAWQTGASPLFACINDYPENDFQSIIDYLPSNNENEHDNESFCIVSRNANRRVIITTLGLDLENNSLLENFISYIAKGEPSIYFKSCGTCGDTSCDFVDLLNSTKIHFSDNDKIKSLVKYEICNCSSLEKTTINEDGKNNANATIIPLKQLLPINKNSGRVSRSVNVSAVQYMSKLGAQYLRTQLSGGKYGSLMGTLSTLLLFKQMGITINSDDKKMILDYLKAHNKDGETFDAIKESTRIAEQILSLLKYKAKDIKFDTAKYPSIKSDSIMIEVSTLDEQAISYIAKILGRDESIDEILVVSELVKKEFLLKVFSRIISAKDVGSISWEKDCYMTSLMLIVLLKIEKWFAEYDEKNSTNCVAKINIIAAYFEEASEISLYSALISSADAERKKAYDFLLKLLDEQNANSVLKKENSVLKGTERDFESIKSKVRQHQTINIILLFTVVAVIMFFIIVALRARYANDNIYDFIMTLSPIDIVFSLAGIIVIPFTIGTLYWKSSTKPKIYKENENKGLWAKIKSLFCMRK